MSRPKVTVTDRAILRYLEDVEGINLRPIRRKMERAARRALKHGASGITVEGVTYKLQENRVSHVMTKQRHFKVSENG